MSRILTLVLSPEESATIYGAPLADRKIRPANLGAAAKGPFDPVSGH